MILPSHHSSNHVYPPQLTKISIASKASFLNTHSNLIRTYPNLISKTIPKQLKFNHSHYICDNLTLLARKNSLNIQTLSLALFLSQIKNEKTPLCQSQQCYSLCCLLIATTIIQSRNKASLLKQSLSYITKLSCFAVVYHQTFLNTIDYLHIPLFTTFLNYYLTIGILLQTQINHNINIISIENQVLSIAYVVIEKAEYFLVNQQYLALQIVKYVRKKYNLDLCINILHSLISNQLWENVSPYQLLNPLQVSSNQSHISSTYPIKSIKSMKEAVIKFHHQLNTIKKSIVIIPSINSQLLDL